MPIVPFTTPSPDQSPAPARYPDEPWTLMAAAQMHSEGRLVESDSTDRTNGIAQLRREFGPGPMPNQPAGDFARRKATSQGNEARDIGRSFRRNIDQ